MQVGFGDDHGAGLTQLSNLKRIVRRHKPEEGHGARGGLHVRRAVVVLHDYRNSMQRTTRPFHGAFAIESLGVTQGVRVQRDQGIEAGAAMIEYFDAIEICLNQALDVMRPSVIAFCSSAIADSATSKVCA